MVEEICGQPKDGVGVPGIFHGRRVVGVQAPDRVLAEQLESVGVTNVGRVQEDGAGDSGVAGDLNERAEVTVKLAGDEPGNLLGDEIVVGVQPRGWGLILRRFRVGEARHVHSRERHPLPVAAARRVAADFETPAVRRQFRKGGVTGRAWLSGLARVARQGFGGADAEGEKRRRCRDERRQGDSEGGESRSDKVQRPCVRPNRRCRHSAPLG